MVVGDSDANSVVVEKIQGNAKFGHLCCCRALQGLLSI